MFSLSFMLDIRTHMNESNLIVRVLHSFIPSLKMMDGKAFGYGIIIAVVPTILAKIISGLFFCEDPVRLSH